MARRFMVMEMSSKFFTCSLFSFSRIRSAPFDHKSWVDGSHTFNALKSTHYHGSILWHRPYYFFNFRTKQTATAKMRNETEMRNYHGYSVGNGNLPDVSTRRNGQHAIFLGRMPRKRQWYSLGMSWNIVEATMTHKVNIHIGKNENLKSKLFIQSVK